MVANKLQSSLSVYPKKEPIGHISVYMQISKSVVEDSVMREHNGNQSAVVIMMPYGVHSEEQI